MAGRTVAIVGGGTGGLVAARRLRGRLRSDDRVVLVTRDAEHRFAASFLWVMTGARRPDQVTLDLGRLRRRGIEVIEACAEGVDAARGELATSRGPIAYDRLVLAPGADLAPELVPGFEKAAVTPYTLEGAVATAARIDAFHGGRVVVLVSRLPYKCPAAPYETALLVDSILRTRGLRDRSQVEIHTPEPLPMPTAGTALGEAIRQLLAEREVAFFPRQTVERVDTEAGALVFASGDQVGFDLLIGVPPHRAPAIAAESGLAAESGFIPVDARTLATQAEAVYAIGDVTAIPLGGGTFLPKAGIFAHGQAEVVARRIADELAGRSPTASFDGEGGCFLEMGGGVAAYASGDFYAAGGPQIRLRSPGRRWHLGKVLFERYWLRRWV